MFRLMVIALLAMYSGALAEPEEDRTAPESSRTDATAGYCPHLKTQAAEHRIPGLFFIRLIWKESRFNPHAVSPKGAQGIAQFMPGTAAERGLEDPFNPYISIAESARYLRDLMDEFGNPGLAAAAYNAGPQRVRNWLAGKSGLPWETRNFVQFITGMPVDSWRKSDTDLPEPFQDSDEALNQSCLELARLVAPAIPPATGGAPWQPWGVQIAADFSRSKALARYARVRDRYRSVMPGADPMVVSYRNLSLGRRARFAVRIGADDRRAAQQLCDKLRATGGPCMVTKN